MLRRKLSITVAVAASLTIALIPSAGAAVAAAPGPVHYAALGDSYSSGLGAGSYSSDDESCRRSANAYGQLWSDANDPASFTFAACSGATTASVASDQLPELTADTTLVSITVGGNDVGFADVMVDCVFQSDATCLAAVDRAETLMDTTLLADLDALYAGIRDEAPHARVVVLGYPHLYHITDRCLGLSNTKRAALNEGSDHLNTVIDKAAADHGFTFSDVRDEFAGHEFCSGDDWLHSVTWPITESYHPTKLGQSAGYLPAFAGAVG